MSYWAIKIQWQTEPNLNIKANVNEIFTKQSFIMPIWDQTLYITPCEHSNTMVRVFSVISELKKIINYKQIIKISLFKISDFNNFTGEFYSE